MFMPLAASQPATSLSHRLGLTIAGLCEALAARMARDRTAVPLLFLAWTRLRRLAVRFEALLADLRAGRLSAAPSGRGAAETLPQLPGLAGLPPPFRAPRDFGWLLRLAPESAAFAGQVEHLLTDPEMKALLAGSPRAGRMLRPLCRMLGIQSGLGVLAPPRRVRPRGGARPRRGVRASAADGVGLGDASAGAAGPLDNPPRAIPPASLAASGSQCANEFGARPWPAPSQTLVLPTPTSVNASDAGADPPPARQAEQG